MNVTVLSSSVTNNVSRYLICRVHRVCIGRWSKLSGREDFIQKMQLPLSPQSRLGERHKRMDAVEDLVKQMRVCLGAKGSLTKKHRGEAFDLGQETTLLLIPSLFLCLESGRKRRKKYEIARGGGEGG